MAGELGGAELLLEGLAGGLAFVPPGFGFGEPGLDLLVDVRVQGLPDGGRPQVEQVAGSSGPFLGLADLLGGGQVLGVAPHDTGEHGFGRGLLIGLVPGSRGATGDDVGGVGLAASGHADVQGLPGQGLGDEEVGGVDGAALGDVDVAGVGELGVAGEVGPGDPERLGPGPVQALSPHLGIGSPERYDSQRVAIGECAAARVDLGVEARADEVADAGVVAVRQGGLRRSDRAELAQRLGVSRETVRRLAIAGALPHTVMCRGARKTTRRFADEFAASGLEVADLAAFAAAWRARATAPAR